jgi:hypothetical protein
VNTCVSWAKAICEGSGSSESVMFGPKTERYRDRERHTHTEQKEKNWHKLERLVLGAFTHSLLPTQNMLGKQYARSPLKYLLCTTVRVCILYNLKQEKNIKIINSFVGITVAYLHHPLLSARSTQKEKRRERL